MAKKTGIPARAGADRVRRPRVRGTLNVAPQQVTEFVTKAAPVAAGIGVPEMSAERRKALQQQANPIALAVARTYLDALPYAPSVMRRSGVEPERMAGLIRRRVALARGNGLSADLGQHAEDSARLLATTQRLFQRLVLGHVRAQLIDPTVPTETKARLRQNFGPALAEQDKWFKARLSQGPLSRRIRAEFTNQVALVQARNRLMALVRSLRSNEAIEPDLVEAVLDSLNDEQDEAEATAEAAGHEGDDDETIEVPRRRRRRRATGPAPASSTAGGASPADSSKTG